MGFLPAQRVSADQLTACWRAPLPSRAPSRPGFPTPGVAHHDLSQVLMGHTKLPCDHFQAASAHRVCPSELFSPERPSSACAVDALLGVASVARASPSRGCGSPRSRTATSPCCRRRPAVALLGVPGRPRGCPSGRHVRACLRRPTVGLPRLARHRGKTTDAAASRACSKRRFCTAKHPPRSLTTLARALTQAPELPPMRLPAPRSPTTSRP